ncbi:uncharacterized protein LOC114455544 [Gouania willdenowi]|uniref:Uncharacterized LOC114455544 n=1 Tax=Gouania willdenowi TaxID=441366 RepID=A0A8C5GH45_GOUWI|nr:uncharacterized protein LOC114455544 [Gouania willdenowi]
MAEHCTRYSNTKPLSPSKSWWIGDPEGPKEMYAVRKLKGRGHPTQWSPNFEVIDGLLYRKKLERGFINYREVLKEERREGAISTFHRRRPGQHHLSLEETYKCVAENYWWEGMYFQIRDFVLNCPDCQRQCIKKSEDVNDGGCVTKTIASLGADMLNKLRSQREAGLFCDITLRTSGRSFSAHRAVLAAVSDHFQEIFTEMDSGMKADIDLTGFREDSLLSLLDFSYSSTLQVCPEDLPEVIAMARHLGMWPAVEACSALIKELEHQTHPGKGFISPCSSAYPERHHRHRESKRKKVSGFEAAMNNSFNLTLDASDESLEVSPKRSLRRMPNQQSPNGLPLSPSHRMKLMDFKSPSSKKAFKSRHVGATPPSQSYSSMSPSSTRLLRSSPGAAKEVQRMLPMSESPRKMKKSHPVAQISCTSRSSSSAVCSPVRVKQEVEELGEDEEDYARAQEKYKLMYVLGLQRTALLPRPEDLIGWRQKKRLRKLKANNYSLTKRRKPRLTSSYGNVTLSLPLCDPVNSRLLNKSMKTRPVCPVNTKQQATKRSKSVQPCGPPCDRSMRSKGALPEMFLPAYGGRELRRSVRLGHSPHPQQPLQHKIHTPVVKSRIKIKTEPEDYYISSLQLSSNGFHDPTPHRSPSTKKPQPRNKIPVETVKALRYNSGRPAAKPKLRQKSSRQIEKTKGQSRPEVGKVRGQDLGSNSEPRLHFSSKESNRLQFAQHSSPLSVHKHPLYKVIKDEPAEPVPVGGPFPDPPSPDLGKRQSKPPIKLLDSGFLFSFCRPAGGPMAVLKKEEESVDICLTRSVSQVRDKIESPHRTLRTRASAPHPVVKKERANTHRPKPKSRTNAALLARCVGLKPAKMTPKQQQSFLALSKGNGSLIEAVRRARLRQLRGPRSQAPKGSKAAHTCVQCPASYQDCDALIMHGLRHVEGKHWPCPLCSKTFFRLRNVRNHIRTHDPKLYKCRSCIRMAS